MKKNQTGLLYSSLGSDAFQLARFAVEYRKAFTGETTFVGTKAGLRSFPRSLFRKWGYFLLYFLQSDPTTRVGLRDGMRALERRKGKGERGTKVLL